MSGLSYHAPLAFALLAAGLFAACGGAPAPPPEIAPTNNEPVRNVPGDADAPKEQAPKADNTRMQPSKMLGALTDAGVDLKAGVRLADLPMPQKKKVMRLFNDALGYEGCAGCHAEGPDGKLDMHIETRHMKIAERMYDDIVLKLRDSEGGLLFCDSCHNGSEHILNKGDKTALKALMKQDYVAKLQRADGQKHECATCHSEPFQGDIFADVWGIPKSVASK